MTNNPSSRHYQFSDKILICLDQCINTIFGLSKNTRANPADPVINDSLTESEKKCSAALMRINHTGEVCAQALYLGQSLTSKDKTIKKELQNAAIEEQDHLNWCKQRIEELGGRTSLLNPFWFGSSFVIGITAGFISDKISLGFLNETEQQVGKHLESHLKKLPEQDYKSRAIVGQMLKEELEHADLAQNLGAATLPEPVKWTMQSMSKVMTTSTYYV
jgi:ubiquinone biosynthesis monooxygenase Coq7